MIPISPIQAFERAWLRLIRSRAYGLLLEAVACYDTGDMARTYRATYLQREKWWVGWSEDVPGGLTQGKTLAEVKANLRDAIRLMLEPANLDALPPGAKVVQERIRL